MSGVVAVLAAEDLPHGNRGQRSDRGTTRPREEVVFAGQPVALVVAESEAAAEDGRRQSSSTTSRSTRSSMSSRRWKPTPRSPSAATMRPEQATSDRCTRASTAAKGRWTRRPTPRTSSTRCGDPRATWPLRSRPAMRSSRRRSDALDLSGVPRASGLHRLARPRGTLVVSTSTRGRSSRGGSSPERSAFRWSAYGSSPSPSEGVRREVRARRASRGRRSACASSAGPDRVHARRGLPGDEPGLGPGHRADDRWAQ